MELLLVLHLRTNLAGTLITTLSDLEEKKLQNPERLLLIKRNLNTAYQKQGRLIDEKTGIVNLVPLGEAAKIGDIKAVKTRLQAGVSQNQIYENSLPILLHCLMGMIRLLKF